MTSKNHNLNKKFNQKTRCFVCQYEIKSKAKLINYKNTTIKICTSCNSNKKLTISSQKYKSNYIDCSICNKAVIYNSNIPCTGCNHLVHRKCTSLSSEDITNIESTNSIWHCSTCMEDMFPFSKLNTT